MGIFGRKKELEKVKRENEIHKKLRKQDGEKIKRLASDGLRHGSPEGAKEMRDMQNK